ncbi:10061_t:CDS:2, partial [Scutellospora calospora]
MEPTPTSTQEETLPDDSPPSSHAPPGYYVSNQFPPLTPTSVYRCPTLTAFLHQLNLSQYHSLFVEAGVGENDLEQFIGFDESELKEVLSAISMKPFHSAAFKRGIRGLRQTLSASPSSLNNSSKSFTTFSTASLELPSDNPNSSRNKLGKISETTEISSYNVKDKAMDASPIKISPNRTTNAEESAESPIHEIQ